MNSAILLPARLRFPPPVPSIAVGAADDVGAYNGPAQHWDDKQGGIVPTTADDTGHATSRVNEPDAPPAPKAQAPAPKPATPAPVAPTPVAPAQASSALAFGKLPWRTIGFAAGGVALALLGIYLIP